MTRKITKQLLVSMLLIFYVGVAFAQDRAISGTVKDDKGELLPFVSYKIKGTTTGGVTDDNGSFRVTVNGTDAILVFSFIGYKTKEVSVGNSSTISVTLESDAKALEEVVVTALGIKREKKSLGYAVQEIKGETLVQAREANITNALTGKVAGLQVMRSSTGPAGSSKIVLRGNNSLTGNNQPLIVVDGVPVNNFTGAINNDFYNPTEDMGNGLSDINAEDIESISVLKGGAAAALYGSRAGNGVILITTKTGKNQKGLGITVNSSFGVESIFTNPETQKIFGQGTNGTFNPTSTASWGPKITGQTVTTWNNQSVPLTAYDNIENYMGKGYNSNQSVALQQQYKSTSFYTSFNRLDNKSIIPGAKLGRTNLLARSVSRFGQEDRWTVDTKVQYANANATNRPIGGNRRENPFYTTYLFPVSLNIKDFENAVDQNGNMYWYGEPSAAINPYWTSQYNNNNDIRNRFLLNGSVKYEFTSWLSGELKGGADFYTTNIEAKLYGGSPIAMNGRFSMGKDSYQETNFSTLFTAKKDNLFGKLGGTATLGGNLMNQESSSINSSSGELNARDVFSLNNGKNNPTVVQGYSQRKMNSVYGSLGMNWDGYLFIDLTGRNDWTSTLNNNSFFYPSASLSYVFTDMLSTMGKTIPKWISYGKLRASYAEVGNDMAPYQLYNVYDIGKDPNGNTTATRGNTLFDPNVVNELIKSSEIGAEMRFLKSRVGFDISWYKSNATNQLLNLPMDPLSGYSFRKINAGDIQNVGFEAIIDGKILDSDRSLNWDMSLNYSTNKNTIEALTADVKQYGLGGYDDVQVLAVEGEKFGSIYGTRFLRVSDPNSEHFGQLLLSGTGFPQRDPAKVKLGDQQASALIGVTNSFAYRGVSLSFQVDGRFGGEIFSATNFNMQKIGTAAVTVVNGERQNIIANGVVFNSATNKYERNTLGVTPQLYWEAVGVGNLGVTEANIYDATNVRLRNIQLNYNLPRKFLTKTPVQRATIGVSCNNVWLIKSHLNGVDPESVYATGTNAVGFENASAPTTRSFLFNLSVGF